MHILLTDVVTCPRCGPEFGLIVLADWMESRQVIEGTLGCANCREEYPIRNGIADLRRAPREAPMAGVADITPSTPQTDTEKPYRLAALLGVSGPSGPIAVAASDASLVMEVQRHLPEAGVVGLSAVPPPDGEDAGIGWLLASDRLPFRSRSLGGVVLASGNALPLLEEALRCLGRGARLVVDPAPPGVAEALRREGAELLLEQDGVAVAFDPRAG
jgi:uncharacterized protein YbaR (Trm112 family)